tara:strand:- start:297 stop:524 length:228 start_codon:yes stop_codon:yes gene_type:complete
LNDDNAKRVWNYIRSKGDELQGKLPDSPRHPQGRNPYAHISKCIKSKYKASYKEIEDNKVGEVMNFIDYLVNNPF